MKVLVGIPVYNESKYVRSVLDEVQKFTAEVAVVDDGSSDGSGELLQELHGQGILQHFLQHETNRGYGQSLIDLMAFARDSDYDSLITMDCDEQHQPSCIPDFVAAAEGWDIVSGTRYPKQGEVEGDAPPEDRLRINREITARINQITDYNLTDGFCGFKLYNRNALEKLDIKEPGYAMPMEFWIKAFHIGLTVREIPVRRIYKDNTRQFGGKLNDSEDRLAYYNEVIDRTLREDREQW